MGFDQYKINVKHPIFQQETFHLIQRTNLWGCMDAITLSNTGLSRNYSKIDYDRFTAGFLQNAKKFAFELTGHFEGGKPGSLQIKDAGIISYGKHQATLASGALYEVIRTYSELSSSKISVLLRPYLKKLQNKQISLRQDRQFINLLIKAAQDPLMKKAQDAVFHKKYWRPVVEIAREVGINSEIGLAVLYDTNIQGGLKQILDRTLKDTKNLLISERDFLNIFLNERRKYLLNVAAAKRRSRDAITAQALERDAKLRIGKLKTIVDEFKFP